MSSSIDPNKIDFTKGQGLVPAIIQHFEDGRILMLGYMNREALDLTLREGKLYFYSRTKKRLWMKGESSGNLLFLSKIYLDCDSDSLLILARPHGPVCHSGTHSCFGDDLKWKAPLDFLMVLEQVIKDRARSPNQLSYTSKLLQEGVSRIAQKVGEEATEVVIEALQGKTNRLKEEASDLIYHLMLLLENQGLSLGDVVEELRSRHKA